MIPRNNADGASGVTLFDTSQPAAAPGRITEWDLWADGTGPVKLEVFRPTLTGYELIGENDVEINQTGLNSFPIAPAAQIVFEAGDLLGFRYNSPRGLIALDYNAGELATFTWPWPDAAYDVAVGQTITYGDLWYGGTQARTYSLSATVSAIPDSGSTLALLAGACVLLAAPGKTKFHG